MLNLLNKFTNFYQVRETVSENFDFVPSLSFFLSSFTDKLNSKNIVCMQVVHISNDCSGIGHLPFLVWGGVRATTASYCLEARLKLSPETPCVLGR